MITAVTKTYIFEEVETIFRKYGRSPSETAISNRQVSKSVHHTGLSRNFVQYSFTLISSMPSDKDHHSNLLGFYLSLFQLARTVTDPKDLDERVKQLLPQNLDPKSDKEALAHFNQITTRVIEARKTPISKPPPASQNPTHSPSILALPGDILIRIFRFNKMNVVGRLVCRQFYHVLSGEAAQKASPKVFRDKCTDLTIVAATLVMPALNHVEIDHNHTDSISNVSLLALLVGCAGLQVLRIAKGQQTVSGYISTEPFKLLAGRKLAVRHLILDRSFSKFQIVGEDLRNIGAVCPELQSLHITHRSLSPKSLSSKSPCTEEDLKTLATQCPQLECLHIGALPNLSKEFLLRLPSLFSKLISIDLSLSQADDDVIEALAAKQPGLRDINLDVCNITDRSLQALMTCKQLTKVSLRKCYGVTVPTVKKLLEMFPNIEMDISFKNHNVNSLNCLGTVNHEERQKRRVFDSGERPAYNHPNETDRAKGLALLRLAKGLPGKATKNEGH